MIEYIRGQVAELTPTQAVIDCGGVGYGAMITLTTYAALQGKSEARLWIYESIREDAYVLFGFASRRERELFLLLISVSGIGGQIARMVLSAFTPSELVNIIAEQRTNMLKSVKGIGPKAANRIIIELQDKVAALSATSGDVASGGGVAMPVRNETLNEAEAALTMLGFAPAAVRKVLTALQTEHPDATVEDLIKAALKAL